MDEVENPSLPAAGESSPTLRPVDQDDNDNDNDNDGEDISFSKPGVDTAELIDSANPSPLSQPAVPTKSIPTRPGLTREGSVPPPQHAPPTAPPSNGDGAGGSGSGDGEFQFPSDQPDSLTLADLKRIRSTFPPSNTAPPPKQVLLSTEKVYDFEYTDAQSLPVEVEEWFTYSDEEEVRLRKCKALFNEVWRAEHEGEDWKDVETEVRREFVLREVEKLRDGKEGVTENLMVLVYLSLGMWEETAGRSASHRLEETLLDAKVAGGRLDEYDRSSMQIQWIIKMIHLLHDCDGLTTIYDSLCKNVEATFTSTTPDTDAHRLDLDFKRGDSSTDLWCSLTLFYLLLEVARTSLTSQGKALKQSILTLEPKPITYLTTTLARLRWDDTAAVPFTKITLLAWKSILVTFGGIADCDALKATLRPPEEQEEKDKRTGQPIITASPLDYHLFRQEINSKYPAYAPPENVFKLEPESNSILPPLKHRQQQSLSSTTSSSDFPGLGGVGQSTLHAPIHIATPAPSPPPSPAGPGKAGKKQNYQTNNLFPFLYPPLDARSSDLGGKGSTALQDALVGRRWEGEEVPASIAEAAELFRARCRSTRGMRQLWECREGFVVWERGWKGVEDDDDESPEEVFGDDGDEDGDVEGFELVSKPKVPEEETAGQGEPMPEKSAEEKKLEAVGGYYRETLPHLQSMVVVLMRAILQQVTDLITKQTAQPNGGGLQPGISFASTNHDGDSAKPPGLTNGDSIESTSDEIDHFRTQEIASKAITGIVLLLLKWFKVSHILQYEYLTQLLLDCNYVPLVLKLSHAQEVGRAVHYRLESGEPEKGFWWFCQVNGRAGPPPLLPGRKPGVGVSESGVNGTMLEESEDEAAPPPIKREREAIGAVSPTSHLRDDSAGEEEGAGGEGSSMHPPEVDDLGYPTTPLPTTPIRSYSWRNLFSSINHLRILQKVTRRKTHRALLLVSYKSTGYLRKSLKVPVPMLRYYTLKLFKTQVPFCGRKWRQGNMKIITAVWLTIPAELRDDWLSGGGGGMGGSGGMGDVDGSVEDALPLEQGVRELVHWWNVKNYPEAVGVEKGVLGEEADFFARELERMGVEKAEEEVVMEEMGLGGLGVGQEEWRGPIEGY